MEKYFSISQFARLQGITRKALIFYDNLGIFKPSYKNPENGYRYYGIEKIYEFDNIRTMIETGTSLDTIKKYKLQNSPSSDYFKIQQFEVSKLMKKIQDYQLIVNNISARISEYNTFLSINMPFSPFVKEEPEANILKYDVEFETISNDEKLYEFLFSLELPFLFGWGTMYPCDLLHSGSMDMPNTIFFYNLFKQNSNNNITRPSGKYLTIYHQGSLKNKYKSYEKIISYLKDHLVSINGFIYEYSVIGISVTSNEDEHITKIQVRISD